MNSSSAVLRRMEPTIPAIMFIFGVISNLIAIVVLCKSRREQKETTFYTLVCGLAVTDLLGTVLASPVTIATYVKGAWPDGEPLCQYFGFVLLFFSLAGLSIICAMSIERYIAINPTYYYNDYADKRLAGVALVAIYASDALFCALPGVGFGEVKMQYPQTWCFIDWRTNVSAHVAFSYMYTGFSSVLVTVTVTVVCNVLVCCALIRMHRRFVRRTSLGADASDPGRNPNFGRLAGAEVQMVILLIATSAVVLICSIPLVVQVFLNQIYKTEVEKRLEKNPDLLAIRFASTNPILDPWIYILLQKALLSKVIQNIKCLFCKMGSQQSQSGFQCRDGRQLSSRDSPSDAPQELRDVTSMSQTGLYLPERDLDTCQSSEVSSQSGLKKETNSECTEQALQRTLTSECFQEKSI
ncbi:prostaglandin E receptor 4 (subtype EP4) a [Triplophysa rosa]|uniref:Prostaglandin E2 receptor EP4 subtype n=1 Tax=Triplophysa rosa TaxID=992332 RepID=A0A9W7TKY3_TRIRA|nr:prostaglandin E receptor 4 (subtype EP4) a [Triplophysa rosa]KAI7798291.1 Prostaglandin E receptor 4 subtype EP4 a [Triplophysa rosa]